MHGEAILAYGYDDGPLEPMVPGSMFAGAVVPLSKEPYSHCSHLLCRQLYYSSAGQTVALYACFGPLLIMKSSTLADQMLLSLLQLSE